jgi:5-methylcytosine-specific restriction protein B
MRAAHQSIAGLFAGADTGTGTGAGEDKGAGAGEGRSAGQPKGARAMRPDANQIALRAARSILEAAAPLELPLPGGATARVAVQRMPGSAWPAGELPGLSEATDGPWPEVVRLDCRWKNGRAALLMGLKVARGQAPHGGLVGIRVTGAPAQAARSALAHSASLVWISIPQAIRSGHDGARVWVTPSTHVLGRALPARARAAAFRSAARSSGLPLAGPRRVEAFAVRLPEGEVLPLPGDAFARIVHMAILLLPFASSASSASSAASAAVRGRVLFEGEPPFTIDAVSAPAGAEGEGRGEGARRARIYPLPGGVRRYKATLDALTSWVGEARPRVLVFRDVLGQRYGAPGRTAADDYLRLLEATRLVERRGDAIALTGAGEEYERDPTEARLFERMHASFAGLLETLVLAATPGIEGLAPQKRLLEGLLSRQWRAPSQMRFRRSWLLSMGLVERTAEGDVITEAGRDVLCAHADEAAEIRRRIEDLLEEEMEADLAKADAAAAQGEEREEREVRGGEGEEGSGGERRVSEGERADEHEGARVSEDERARVDERVDERVTERVGKRVTELESERAADPAGALEAIALPARWSHALHLRADAVRPHLHELRVSDALLRRACAALSSGKHLLLVGPPGTGKTDLALAIGAAAAAEGYCRDILAATASADWTTFDTIGGYALERGGAVRFRPGIFLRAIERREWLLVDELNRADIDRAFGELLTALAGRSASTPFTLEDGRLVSVGPDAGCSHRVPPSFRLLATMNTWDKTSLFRLSYAVQRRFATIHVEAPDDAGYEALLRHAAVKSEGAAHHASSADAITPDPPLDPRSLEGLTRVFSSSGLLALRPVGPAIALDMVRYMRRRDAGGDGFAEAASMILLPQLEGLAPADAVKAHDLLRSILSRWASEASITELRARFRELFPTVRLPDA